MKTRLNSLTSESAWDKIMQGAFQKVFKKTPSLSQVSEFQSFKKMNFIEITKVL